MTKIIEGIKLYTILDVAKLLEVAPDTIRRYIKNGRLKSSKLGRAYYVTEDTIKNYVNGNKSQ